MIKYQIVHEEEILVEPENIELDIVFEDESIIVINKPSGMVVHPGAGNKNGTLVNALMYHSNQLSDLNGSFRPGIVHRIDKDTSGLLVVAKTNDAHKKLAQNIKEHKIDRKYVCIVHGLIAENSADIDAPIGRDPSDRKKMIVIARNSKLAYTSFDVMKRYKNYTLLECKLKTGRTHQIRVHMKYIGYPIVGDPVYGKKNSIDTKGQALHAKTLSFNHPVTDEIMSFEAPLPEEFLNTLEIIENDK
jgi:23S rRNA pseudouridine1911/1915/1917 synthase